MSHQSEVDKVFIATLIDGITCSNSRHRDLELLPSRLRARLDSERHTSHLHLVNPHPILWVHLRYCLMTPPQLRKGWE